MGNGRKKGKKNFQSGSCLYVLLTAALAISTVLIGSMGANGPIAFGAAPDSAAGSDSKSASDVTTDVSPIAALSPASGAVSNTNGSVDPASIDVDLPIKGDVGADIIRVVVPTTMAFVLLPEIPVHGVEDLDKAVVNSGPQYRMIQNLSDVSVRVSIKSVAAFSDNPDFKLVNSLNALSDENAVLMTLLPEDAVISNMKWLEEKALTTSTKDMEINRILPGKSTTLKVYGVAKTKPEHYFKFTVTPTIKLEVAGT